MKTGIGKSLGVLVVAGLLSLALSCTFTPITPDPPTDSPVPTLPPTEPPALVSPTVSIAASQGGGSQSIDLLSGQSLLLALNLTGEIVDYQWSLDGRGVLDKTEPVSSGEGQTNRYTAPKVTGSEILDEAILITVIDRNGKQAQDRIFVRISAGAVIVAMTPTPPTRTPPPATPVPPVTVTADPPTVTPPTAIPPTVRVPTVAPPTAPPPTVALPCIVNITDPPNNGIVSMSASAQGTVTTACEAGPSLWLMVEIGGRTWPQERVSGFPTGDGQVLSWFVGANVGAPGDAGKVFGMKVMSTNDQIDAEFAAWFIRGQQTGNWPGFIPQNLTAQGAKVLAGIGVTRN